MYVGATSHTNSKFNLLRNSKLFSLRMDQWNRPMQSSVSLRPHCLLFFSFVFGCDNSHPNGCEVAACCSLTMAKYAQRDICHLQHLKMRSTAALAESEIYWRNIIYTPDCSNPCDVTRPSTAQILHWLPHGCPCLDCLPVVLYKLETMFHLVGLFLDKPVQDSLILTSILAYSQLPAIISLSNFFVFMNLTVLYEFDLESWDPT